MQQKLDETKDGLSLFVMSHFLLLSMRLPIGGQTIRYKDQYAVHTLINAYVHTCMHIQRCESQQKPLAPPRFQEMATGYDATTGTAACFGVFAIGQVTTVILVTRSAHLQTTALHASKESTAQNMHARKAAHTNSATERHIQYIRWNSWTFPYALQFVLFFLCILHSFRRPWRSFSTEVLPVIPPVLEIMHLWVWRVSSLWDVLLFILLSITYPYVCVRECEWDQPRHKTPNSRLGFGVWVETGWRNRVTVLQRNVGALFVNPLQFLVHYVRGHLL